MKKIVVMMIMIMMLSFPVHAEEEVEVELPEFDVVINGYVIDNHKEDFPFIEYNGITYLPMTYDLSASLGLTTFWSSTNGLQINKAKEASAYISNGTTNNRRNKMYKASKVSFPVSVNGEVIDNAKEEYPLLTFRDVTYFPMTYRFMVTAFSSGYNFTADKGLEVSVDQSIKMKYPEKVVKTFDVDIEELNNNYYFANEFIRIQKKDGYLSTEIINFDKNSEYAGTYLNVYADYYDLNDKYVMTRVINAGIPEGYGTRDRHYGGMVVYQNTSKITFRFEFENVFGFNQQVKEIKQNYKVAEVMSEKATLEYLKSLGGAFMSVKGSRLNGANKSFTFDEYIYCAFNTEHEHNVNGMEISISNLLDKDDSLILDIEPRSDEHVEFNTIDSIEYDPLDLNDQVYVKRGSSVLDIFGGNFVYLYNKEKDLVAIVILKDMK